MEIALGIILLVISVALIVAVLFQNGKSHNLSGTIAGGADTFFGKSKSNSRDIIINRITTICAIVFVIVVLIFYATTTEGSYTGKVTETDQQITETTTDSSANQ